MKKARIINVIVWFLVTIVLMVACYYEWSRWNEYTILSFVSSLILHGGFCLLLMFVIDEQIVKFFKKK